MLIFKKNWFQIGVFLLLLLAGFLRFYNYSNRWGLAFDQAHDVLVAREGIRRGILPLLGPFASGANIVGGPQWYWIIMLFSLIKFNWILTPWICLTILYVFFVYLIIKIGREIEGKTLGLVAGLIAVFSPNQISQGVNLTNQSPMALISAGCILVAIKYLKTKKPIYLFILGNLVAMGISIHLQGIGLLFFLLVVLIFTWPHKLKSFLFLSLGLILQFLPWIIFDLNNNFYNLRGFWQYYRYEQYKIWIPNRWVTYAGIFWPNLWAKIAGGNYWLSLIQGAGIGIFFTYFFLKKRLKKEILILGVSFLLIFIALRYYRGERFDSYYVFTHPFVIFLSGWFIFHIFKWKKIFGIIILLISVWGSLIQIREHYKKSSNNLYPQLKKWEKVLIEKFPEEKFAVYDYKFENKTQTTAFTLVLDVDKLISDEGIKVGVGRDDLKIGKEPIYKNNGLAIFEINDLKKEGDEWAFLNPSEIWKATEEWYKN